MATQGQYRGGSYWHGVMAGNLTLDPRTAAAQVYESQNATRTLTLVSARLLRVGVSVCHVYNIGTHDLTVKDAAGTSLGVLATNECGVLSLFDSTATAGVWTLTIRAAHQLTAPPPTRTIWSFGGVVGGTTNSNDGFEYNQQTDVWVQHTDVFTEATLGDASSGSCAAVFPEMFISGGGNTVTAYLSTYRFTSSTLTGTGRADATRRHTGSGATLVDGFYHAYGGYDSAAPSTGYGEVYKYDDASSGTWTEMIDSTTPRYWCSFIGTTAATSYAYGGWVSITNAVGITTMDEIKPDAGTTVAQPPSLIGRYGCGGAYINGLLIYPCDYQVASGKHSNTVQAYDPTGMVWTERTPLSALDGAFGASVATTDYLGDKIWLVGGWGGSTADGLRTFEMTPGATVDTWVEKQPTATRIRTADAGGVALQPSP